MPVSTKTTRTQETLDRALLVKGASPQNLFNREYGYNYLCAVLIGRAPKNLDNVSYPQGATSHLCTMTTDKNGAPVRLARNEIAHGARRARKTHTRKSEKGSSSSSQGKRYALHQVEDTLQSAFLHYWENRDKEFFHVGQGETQEQASARITRKCCRNKLMDNFRRMAIEKRALKLISSRAFSLMKNNDDMLSAETLCDTLAEMLSDGNAKQARIIRATMAKTTKIKCLARAMKCHRNTVNNRLSAITLETDIQETSSKIGTLGAPTVAMSPSSPILPVDGLQPVKVFHPAKSTCLLVTSNEASKPDTRNIFAFLATGIVPR